MSNFLLFPGLTNNDEGTEFNRIGESLEEKSSPVYVVSTKSFTQRLADLKTRLETLEVTDPDEQVKTKTTEAVKTADAAAGEAAGEAAARTAAEAAVADNTNPIVKKENLETSVSAAEVAVKEAEVATAAVDAATAAAAPAAGAPAPAAAAPAAAAPAAAAKQAYNEALGLNTRFEVVQHMKKTIVEAANATAALAKEATRSAEAVEGLLKANPNNNTIQPAVKRASGAARMARNNEYKVAEEVRKLSDADKEGKVKSVLIMVLFYKKQTEERITQITEAATAAKAAAEQAGGADPYYARYMKYKNKYLALKKELGM